MRLFSLQGKLILLFVGCALFGALIATALARWFDMALLSVPLALLVMLPFLFWLGGLVALPVARLLRALSGSVVAFRDGDFSFSIGTERRDELGELVHAHNELGRVLRDQRQNLFQRELLLDTVVQNSPTAMLLTDNADHIVYANIAARQLLNSGRALAGLSFAQVIAETPAILGERLASGQDGLFTVTLNGEEETFHLSQRAFRLQGQQHTLYLLKRLTRELSRQEVQTWKKVIRVISHELNNSLAPISSLAHSGRELARKGDLSRLTLVFDTIEERTRHLDSFIRGYAEFAKLPQPRLMAVVWSPFIDGLARQHRFQHVGNLPPTDGWFDRAQIEQVLINVLKNAHESGSPADDVQLELLDRGSEVRIEMRDRGSGMNEQVLANALVPFYSTKRSGTGLGLALAREIAEAHGGRIALSNRDGGGLTVSITLPNKNDA